MKENLLYKLVLILTLPTTVFSINTLSAQDTTSIKNKWYGLVEIYMMFPNMTGQTTVANLPEVNVDANVSDILGHLKMGAMLYAEATNNNWSITSDFIYMKLGQDVVPDSKLIQSGDAIMKQYVWELAGLKRITPWLDGGIGGRLIDLYAGLNIQTIQEYQSGSASKLWYDPVLILRSNNVLKDNWLIQLRGDVGGFGIGSDFTWQAQAYIGYRFSKLFQTTFGYRYIAIDYDKGEGKDRFLYDIDTFGAVLRFGFNF
jgi:hypothetical protein